MTNEVIQNILTRCSVRAYDDRPVEREKIDTLLQCAVHAPSAMNRQTWHFSAVLNREKIEADGGCGQGARQREVRHV